MHDAIKKVLATEVEARRMVQSAKAEAEQILVAARKRAQECTNTAQQEIQQQTQKILTAALKQAENDKQARLANVGREIERQLSLDATVREQTVAAVVRCVCS